MTSFFKFSYKTPTHPQVSLWLNISLLTYSPYLKLIDKNPKVSPSMFRKDERWKFFRWLLWKFFLRNQLFLALKNFSISGKAFSYIIFFWSCYNLVSFEILSRIDIWLFFFTLTLLLLHSCNSQFRSASVFQSDNLEVVGMKGWEWREDEEAFEEIRLISGPKFHLRWLKYLPYLKRLFAS